MNVVDLMSGEVVTVSEESSISRARRLLTQRGISALPVVNGAAQLVGIVSSRDFLGVQPGEERVPVRKLMHRRVLTISAEVDVGQLAHAMGEQGIHHAVVVEGKSVRGIVSSLDLLRALGTPTPAGEQLEMGAEASVDLEESGFTLLDSSPASDSASHDE